MEKRKQAVFSLPEYLKKGDWVDAKEKEGNYKLAKVVHIEDKEVSIRFEDFDEYRRDCKLYIDSSRLAPLRRYTVGYTGPKYLNRDLNLDIARFPEVIAKMMEINEGKEQNAYELTQFLRARVYMIVEHILSFPSDLLNKQELKDAISFLQFYIKWAVQFNRQCLKFAQTNFEQLINNKESYLTNYQIAEIASMSEVYYCIQLILMIKGEYRNKLYKVVPDKEQRFKALLIDSRGVDVIVRTLEFKDQAGRGFPAMVRIYALVILHSLKIKFSLPEFDVRDHIELPKIFPSMLELYPSQKLQNDIISYSLKLMSGQNNFETRLKGLNELKSNLQSVKSRDTQNVQFKKITEDRFLALLKEARFFENLLNKKTFNPEIFKRSVPLLKFLSEKKAFGTTEIKHIFLLAEDRHQSDKRLMYDTISQIAAFSPVDILDNLWYQLAKLPLDEATVDVLQNFTIKAIRNISSQSSFFDIFRKRRSSPKYDLYAVNYFWSEIQDNSKLNDLSLIQFILASLKTMFTHSNFSYARETYLDDAVNNLKKKYSIGQSLRLFIDIIMTYNADSYLLGSDSRHEIIQKMDKKYKLLDIFFNALKVPDYGKMGYTLSIQYLFEFLQSFNENLKTSLKINDITSLWKAEYSMSPMLAFLRKHKLIKYSEKLEYQEKYYKKLSDNLIRELFDNIFLKPKMMNNYNISDEIFETVDQLFLSMHISQKNIRFKDKTLIRVAQSNKQLEGSSFFFNIIHCGTSTPAIINKSIKRYVGLNVRVIDGDTEDLVSLWRSFSDKILGNIEMEPNKANQLVPILYDFFLSIEGMLIRANIVERSSVAITVFYKEHQVVIELSKQSSLFKLHQLIKEKFPSVKNFKLALVESDKIITFQEEEDFSVKSLESKNNVIKIVEVEKNIFDDALMIYKNHISKSKIYEVLLSLLINPQVQQDLVWNVLDVLPRSKTLMEKLNNPRESEKEWPTFFSDKVEILVYKLKLVKELVLKDEWLLNFTSGSGVRYLVQRIVKNTNKLNEKEMKCLLLLINNLIKCLDSKFEKETLRSIDYNQMIKALGETVIGNLHAKPNKYSIQLLNSSLELIIKLLKNKQEYGKILTGDNLFYSELATKGIVLAGESNTFIEKFNELFKSFVLQSQQELIVTQLVQILGKQESQSTRFFDLLVNCFNNLKNQDFLTNSPQLISLIKKYCNRIFSANINQKSDQLLYGAFKLKLLLVKKNLVEEEEKPLLDSLISSYILPVKGGVKLHLQASLHEYYDLLVILISRHPEFCQLIFQRLASKLKLYEKSSIKYDWGVELEKQPRKKYCGLRNLRATCYINSLIQQLYMIQPFRQAIIRQNSESYRENPKENEILQFQKVFTYLKQSKKSSYNPKEFLESFKDFDGNQIDVTIQGDVDEFYNSLMEKLETFLKKNNDTHIIDDVFSGQLSNQLICQANHKSERFEHYTSIGLNIKNKSSLEQALQGYVQGEVLQGDNAYFCEGCKEKVKTVKRICVKTLPNVLIIVLKRFEFNYDTMKKYKVNDYCSFPFDLNMKKYTSEYLNNSNDFYPDEYYDFKLRGVIVHYGTSEAGHYYSYIKDSNEWFEFNDEMVMPFNPSSIESQTFGGTETFGQDLQYKTERCKNAYMLFYERTSCFNTDVKPTKTMIQYPMSSPQQQQLHNMVTADNSSYEFMSYVYDMNFINFISELLVSNPASAKLGLFVFHNIVLKHRHKQDIIVGIGEKLEDILKKDKELSMWYINQFNHHIIKEYLIEAFPCTKYIVTGLLCTAINTVDIVDRKNILMFMSFLESRGMTPFARVFKHLSYKKQNRDIMLELEFPSRVIDIMKNENPVMKSLIAQDWSVELFQNPIPERTSEKPIKYISLIESLQNFEISAELIEPILPHMTSTMSINMIAKIVAKNCRTTQDCEKVLKMIQINIMKGDEKEIKQFVPWMREIMLQHSQNNPEIITKVIEIYLNCFEPFYKTYIPFEALLRNLFKFCDTVPAFQVEVEKQFKKYETVAKLIETWISKCGNAYHLITTEDWTTYKKKSSGKIETLSPSQYRQKKQELENAWKKIRPKDLKKEEYQQKQKPKERWYDKEDKYKEKEKEKEDDKIVAITTCEQFLEGENEKYIIYPKISHQKLKAKIEGKVGFLYQVTIQKGLLKYYWFTGDNDELTFQNFV